MPGLRAALWRASLGHKIVEAETWCEDMGAAYLSECEENIELLGGALMFGPEEERTFLAEAARWREGPRPCRATGRW